MNNASLDISKARASSVSLQIQPWTYVFHPQAHVINHAKCRWLVDEIWKDVFTRMKNYCLPGPKTGRKYSSEWSIAPSLPVLIFRWWQETFSTRIGWITRTLSKLCSSANRSVQNGRQLPKRISSRISCRHATRTWVSMRFWRRSLGGIGIRVWKCDTFCSVIDLLRSHLSSVSWKGFGHWQRLAVFNFWNGWRRKVS